jgi:hypothetical protein
MKESMARSVEPQHFELPLELQFAMRKAELQAEEMTWDELYSALLNLYHQRLMEWQAVKEILADENIDIDFGHPTDIELAQLAAACIADDDEEDDEDEYFQPF